MNASSLSLRQRAARLIGSAVALTSLITIAACSGGGGNGMGQPTQPSGNMSVTPTSIVLGGSATLTWSASSGTTCTASGAWSGSEPASGTATVTPTSAGTQTYTLTCSGGAYSAGLTLSTMLTVEQPSSFTKTVLVADVAGVGAQTVDPALLNPWGIAFGATSPVWVANNHSGTSTVYDGNGKAQPAASPRVVDLPAATDGTSFDPTGIVFNPTSDFVVSNGSSSAPAVFLFDGEGGMIAGWAPAVAATTGIITYQDTGGAVYKGLAIANDGTGNHLYATDFHNGKIDVFDATFQKVATSGTVFPFNDPGLPAGYAPFGIQAVANGPGGSTQIYVSYAKQAAPDSVDDEPGPGLGLVNVFDADGNLVMHLIAAGGELNAPWGMAIAPADLGTWAGALLVGNFGDGRINAFNASTGAFIGTLSDSGNQPIAVSGLWGIAFGNDAYNQPHSTLFYSAGTNNESDGEYGRIDLGSTPPVLNAPPAVALSVPAGTLSGTVTLTATVQDSVPVSHVEFFLNGSTSLGTATAAPFTVQWDTTTVADGSVTLTATATDVNGNVGTSSQVNATVSNTAAATTLTQIQAQVFTPICSVCHDGSQPANGSLPGSQDLRDGHSYASLVNVPSQEQPALMRVKPGDPANSYLIMKLEGTAGISGARMPFGGPYLDQATIDSIKSWILSGAPNN